MRRPDDFLARYREMENSELLTLAAERANLVPEAIAALDLELQNRQLSGPRAQLPDQCDTLCPLCGSSIYRASGARLLYGQYVCGDCSASLLRRRVLAHFIDEAYFLVVVPVILAMFFVRLHVRSPLLPAVILAVLFYLLRDAYGLDIGKRLMGLEVIDTSSGKRTGFVGAFNRNFPLLIPFMPVVIAFQIRRGPRLGDKWAGTRVVLRKYRDKAPFSTEPAATAASAS